MTFSSLSDNAYDVATARGVLSTPRGGYRPIKLEMTNTRNSSI